MANGRLLYSFSLFLSLSLLIAPLPLAAMIENLVSFSDEIYVEQNYCDGTYVYLGAEVSSIQKIVSAVKNIGPVDNISFNQLSEQIEEGFMVGDYDTVLDALMYAEMVIYHNQQRFNDDELDQLLDDFDTVMQKLTAGDLALTSHNVKKIECGSTDKEKEEVFVKNLIVTKHLEVCGKTILKGDVCAKGGMHISGELEVDKNTKFKKNVSIKGTLTAGVLAVGSLSVNSLSIASCMDSLCVKNLSVVNETITGTLSVTNIAAQTAAFGKVTIASCMDNLCVKNLSVTNQTITGTLSVANEIVSGTLSVNNFIANSLTSNGTVSLSDLVIKNLSVIDSAQFGFLSSAGVVHNDASGNLSSSLITNADITPGTIANSALATTSSTGTPGSIVVYNGAGTLMVTPPVNPTDVANKAYVDAQIGAGGTNLNVPDTLVERDNTGSFAAQVVSVVDQVVSSTATITPFTTAGIVHNNASGLLSSSLIANADITNGTIANAKLATISSTGTPGSIVVYNPAGNFTVTPPVNPTDVTTKAYVDSAVGVGGTNLNVPNTLVQRDNTGSFAAQVVSVVDQVVSGAATITPFTTAGVVHNDATGLLSSSLIVNNDITDGTIANAKLATISSTGTPGSIVVYNGAGTIGVTSPINTTDAASKGYVDTQVIGSGTNLNIPNMLVLRDNTGSFASQVISATDEVISNSVIITPFTTSGIVHNNASGLLSSSLIVNNDITNGTIANAKLATISSTGTPGSIVVYNGAGTLAVTTPVNPTDVTTKAYVDSTVASGIIAKTPALVVSTTDIGATPTGLITIDGVALATNNRVLLVGQTNPVNNGLWLAQSGAWTRPADFANGSTVGQAYVLITSGLTEMGSAWLANTPTAVVGTNPITFAEFSLPNDTTGANIGAGTGLVFANTTGATLNFRSLLAGTHITIVNNTSDITFATDATNVNTASTLVARDNNGNFAAGIVSMSDGVHSGNLVLSTDPSTSTAGNIIKGTSRFMHDFGTNNTFVGLNAGNFTMSGTGGNIGFGTSALITNTTGSGNAAVGYQALLANTSGTANTAVGYQALPANATGASNTAIGATTMQLNVTGNFNTAVGANTLQKNTVSNNTAVGYSALLNNTTGAQNTAVGSNALAANTAAGSNTALGYFALNLNTAGNNNTAIGGQSLAANTTGNNNTAVGLTSLAANTTGSQNTGIGLQALTKNTIGTNNTAVGFNSLFANTTGINNTAVGNTALTACTIGTQNTGIGAGALSAVTTGVGNTAIGFNTGNALTTGSSNIYMNNVGVSTESNTIRIGTNGTQTRCFIQGINGVTTGVANPVPVVIDSNGQLGTNNFYSSEVIPILFQASDNMGHPNGGPNLTINVGFTRIGSVVTMTIDQQIFTPVNTPTNFPTVYTSNFAIPAAYLPLNQEMVLFQAFNDMVNQIPHTASSGLLGGLVIDTFGNIGIWRALFDGSANWSQPNNGWYPINLVYTNMT